MDAPEDTIRTRELLDKYLAGDRESEHRLFESHRADLVSKASSARWMPGLRKYVTPEDLVDEVFLRVLGSGLLREFDDRGRGSLGRALAKVLEETQLRLHRRP